MSNSIQSFVSVTASAVPDIYYVMCLMTWLISYHHHHHHHWAAVMSRSWVITSACCFQASLWCVAHCQVVSLQYLPRSTLHRLASLPSRVVLSYGLHVVTRMRYTSAGYEAVVVSCPGPHHFVSHC